MQFPESWLRSLVGPPLSTADLCHLLTMAGLEVEELTPVAPPFSQVVVGHVLSAERHPDADRLKLCRVDTGEHGILQIVCGAPNAEAGMKVPCALVGARLPDLEIRRAKVRGIESAGMLCSARELGLSQDHSGLLVLAGDAPVGADVRRLLALDDHLITLKLTPNRADCLSLTGIAREVAALTGAPLNLPAITPVPPEHQETRNVVLDAPEHCPRYCGRIVRGVDASVPSPAWMKQRLERAGIRSISALVDVTNYVMLELGQPLHAFDDSRLTGAIHVRLPAKGEKLVLLNAQTVEPGSDTALIADDARALAMAGIMGGEESGISLETRDLFLESAFFSPDAIAGKARSLGFSSDASYRYERGVDFTLQRSAIERATRLILDICGGSPGPVVEAVREDCLPKRTPVRLRAARAARVIGIPLGDEQIGRLIGGMGFPYVREGQGDGIVFTVTPPSWRFDIAIEEDLIEELARLHGYDNIPAPAPRAPLAMLPQAESRRGPMALRRAVAARDYHEVVNFSFVEAAWEADFCGNGSPIVLANPIASQMAVMRTSLIGGLVGNLAFNRKRQAERVRVFEIGRAFRKDPLAGPVAGFAQPLLLAGLCAGPAAPEQWGLPARTVDFFDAKGDVEALFPVGTLQFAKLAHPALHPGRAASIQLGNRQVGVLGELHPRWVQKYELGSAPVVFELELEAVLSTPMPEFEEVSRFPVVVRDIALVVPQEVPVRALLATLEVQAPAIVRAVRLFDLYQGKGLEPGQKSLAFRVVMQDTSRTLEDREVEAAVQILVESARREFGAALRG